MDSQEPCDDQGHGTHTMGTMIGSEGDNQIGVAPDAQWCACRNMERGYGTPFTYIECFEWFLAPTDLNNENPDPSKAPHVINNSWGCPPTEGCNPDNFELMNIVVNNLRAAGIVVVVSAGNDGSGCGSVYTPAAIYEGSFSIGATRSNDTIAGFSSRGPVWSDGSNRLKPNVCAPGTNVRSSVPGGGYDYSSGTSMAGPHVAGLVASVSYTHLRAHETVLDLVCRLLLEKKKKKRYTLVSCTKSIQLYMACELRRVLQQARHVYRQ